MGLPTPVKRPSSTSYSAKPGRLNLISRYSKFTKKHRKRVVRYSLLFGNLAIVLIAVFVVVKNSGGNAADFTAYSNAEEKRAINPLDTLTATDIAVNIARMTKLPEELSIVNLADDIRLELATTTGADNEYANKPQILSPDIKTKSDIKKYVVKEGDTVSSIAEKFGVTSDTVRWSNNITGDRLSTGITLTIPPINGVMYKIKSGDTVAKLAQLYKSNEQSIIAFNDIELTGIKVGDDIFIPNGRKPAPAAPVYSLVYRGGGGGGYAYGWCTYYAAAKAGAPGGWGNARTWAAYARTTPGWVVAKRPTVGAIAQTTRMHYLGHVAIVEAVSPDGSMMKISDMNGVAGWGQVGYSDWIPVSSYDWFISRG